MKVIRENEVAMPLAGEPRWWTVEIGVPPKRMELVRVDHSAIDPNLHLLFVFLPPGVYAWPPLVAPTMKLGPMAFEQIKEKGGKVIHYPTKLGRALEWRLVGWKR